MPVQHVGRESPGQRGKSPRCLILSLLVPSKRYTNSENIVCLSFAFFSFFEGSGCFFQFLNDRIHMALSSFKNWKVNTLPLKNIQTETNKVVSVCMFLSRFDGTRGDKYSPPKGLIVFYARSATRTGRISEKSESASKLIVTSSLSMLALKNWNHTTT